MSPGTTPRGPDLSYLHEDLEALSQATTAHPTEDEWAMFASGELDADARMLLVDHLLACVECAAIHRAVTHVRRGASEFDSGAPRATADTMRSAWTRTFLPQALAASLAIVCASLLAWNVRLQQRAADLEMQVAQTGRAPAPLRAPAPTPIATTQPQVNVPIIDLHPPSRTRGEGPRNQVIKLDAETALVTFIVNTESAPNATDYTLDLLDAKSARVWSSAGLKPTADGTLSVALPASFLRVGEYVFVLTDTRGGRVIHRYPVTFASK